MAKRAYLQQVVDRFSGLRLAVLGDIVADLYVTGISDRVSREAPTIIVRQTGEEIIPGGAANVACNISALGAKVELVGWVGRDRPGRQLKSILRSQKVTVTGVATLDAHATVTKTRVLAGAEHTAPQHVLRIDRELSGPLPPATERTVLAKVKSIDRRIDGWILSDYGYGLITEKVREHFQTIAAHKPVLADSRYGILDYRRLTAIKPNEQEALQAAGVRQTGESSLKEAVRRLRRKTGCKVVIVTLGDKGMLVYGGRGRFEFVPAVGTDEIVDLTGAGDTAGAALITALAGGADPTSAAMLANCAGSVVVMKQGCASCSQAELLKTLETYVES